MKRSIGCTLLDQIVMGLNLAKPCVLHSWARYSILNFQLFHFTQVLQSSPIIIGNECPSGSRINCRRHCVNTRPVNIRVYVYLVWVCNLWAGTCVPTFLSTLGSSILTPHTTCGRFKKHLTRGEYEFQVDKLIWYF